MGKTSITIPIGDGEKAINVKADINFQKVKEGSLFPKQNIIHRGPDGKQCVTVTSTVLEGSGKRILFHTSERVSVNEDGKLIPSADVVDWLVDENEKEVEITKFDTNMKTGAGVSVDTKVPREMLRGFVVGDIYEIISADEDQIWNLWQVAKELWDNGEIGVVKEVVMKTGYNIKTGLFVPFVNYDEGWFYIELQLTTKKREPSAMQIPQGPSSPSVPKEDAKSKHVQSLFNPTGTMKQIESIIGRKAGYITMADICKHTTFDGDDVAYSEFEHDWSEHGPHLLQQPPFILESVLNNIIKYPRGKALNYTIEEAEPWIDGTWVPPGDYPIVDVNYDEGFIIIEADVFDDRKGTLLNAKNQEVTIVTIPEIYEEEFEGMPTGQSDLFSDHHYWKNNPDELNSMNREDFMKELVNMELPYTDVQGLVMSYGMVNNLSPKEEEEILENYHNLSQMVWNPPESIASEIYRQLGGNRFKVMTGAKDFIADGNSLVFKLRRGMSKDGINLVRITLSSMDLYDIDFQKFNYKTYDIKTVKEFKGVYNDQLKEIFESTTGIYTSLSNPNNSSDIDDYVEDIASRYYAHRYEDVLKLWKEFSSNHTPEETISLYNILKNEKDITLNVSDLKNRSRSNPGEALSFSCPECGKNVVYEANVVPATWDEPGYIESEWIKQRNCTEDCPMTENDLLEYAQSVDGDYIES